MSPKVTPRYFSYKKNAALAKKIADFWKKMKYARSIPEDRLRQHILWKYHPSFTEVALAECGGKVIGSCGNINQRLRTTLGPLRGMWGFDSLTDRHSPGFNNFTFLRCYKQIISKALRGPSDILLGFPNEKVSASYFRTGWAQLNNVFLYSRAINNGRVFTATRKNCPCALKSIARFDDDMVNLFERLAPSFSLISERDKKFLNWRYTQCPWKKYLIFKCLRKNRTVGYMVLRAGRTQGAIVDILADPHDPSLFDFLVFGAVRIFKIQKKTSVACLASHDALKKSLIRCGFAQKEEVTFSAIFKKEHKKKYRSLMRARNRWHITLGDGDCEMED